MTERLLQFIWQFQYFNKSELTTVAGEPVCIIAAGQYNTNQGPDFTNARIRIDKTVLAGTVELHIKTSGWEKHNHQHDNNYKNVVLHVVWEDDRKTELCSDEKQAPLTLTSHGSRLRTPNSVLSMVPVLELKERVSKILLQRYEDLMNSPAFIPCEKSVDTVRDLTWKSWKERLLVERLVRKAKTMESYLLQSNYHWEEAFWWLLARNFGMKVNADAFEAIARSIPVTILAKQKNQIHQLEALLLGQAGLLEKEFEEDYPKLLKREYRFQKTKHNLRPIAIPLFFLRMRPGNFPTIRLAQLAMLVHESAHLFSKAREAGSVKETRKCFDIAANDYWHYHYRFDETSSFKKKRLGASIIDNIIINSVIPALFAYGNYHGEQKYKDKALLWLEETGAEKNSIINDFQKIGIESKNAYDSQALLELKNEYCNKKRCLECSIGNAILKQMS